MAHRSFRQLNPQAVDAEACLALLLLAEVLEVVLDVLVLEDLGILQQPYHHREIQAAIALAQAVRQIESALLVAVVVIRQADQTEL